MCAEIVHHLLRQYHFALLQLGKHLVLLERGYSANAGSTFMVDIVKLFADIGRVILVACDRP